MWNHGAVTDIGRTVLAKAAGGKTLVIDGAQSGTGTVAETELRTCTSLAGTTYVLGVTNYEVKEQGVCFTVQITSPGDGYTAKQIGLFGHVDNEDSCLLAIYQDETGITIPDNEQMPDFLYLFYAEIQMNNSGNIAITLDPSVLVSQRQLYEELNNRMPGIINDWLAANIMQETGYVIDNSLTVPGAAADAKKTGDAIKALQEETGAVNRDLFASAFEPLGREYYAENMFSSGYITTSGGEGTNSANARSVYLPVATIRAIKIPLGYKLKFVWFSTASASGILGRDEGYQQCGPNILNYVDAPENAQFFRMQLINNDITTITTADLAELSSSIVLYASGGAAALDRALRRMVDLSYNRQLAGRLSTSTFELLKGSMISGSSGSAASDARYARTAIFTMRLDSFRFICPDGFAANVSFYNALLVQISTFIEKQTLRYEGSSYLVFPPASTVGAVVEFHRKDWAVLTDDDVATLASGFRVYAAGSAEIPAIPVSDARAAFVAYMNETCAYLGLENSAFVNASGLDRSNSSCPLDELKLAVAVAGNPLACDLWSTKDRDFYIGGANPRTITVVNNVYGAEPAGALYKLLGGKGGSLKTESESYWRKARLGLYDVNGTPVAVALMGPGQWIFDNMPACTHELLAMMAEKLEGNTPTEGEYLTQLIAKGGGYAAVPVPNAVQAYRNSYAASDLLTIANALHNNASASQTPASTTKTVTMLCALRVTSDLQEVITLVSSDVSTGSGSTFASGDKLTLEEALRIMMMESSNTMAEAIGRVIGTKLLLTRSAKG